MTKSIVFLLVSCSITTLIVGLNLDRIAFLCLTFELGVAAIFAWQIRMAHKRAELEEKNESSRATLVSVDDGGPVDAGRPSDNGETH